MEIQYSHRPMKYGHSDSKYPFWCTFGALYDIPLFYSLSITLTFLPFKGKGTLDIYSTGNQAWLYMCIGDLFKKKKKERKDVTRVFLVTMHWCIYISHISTREKKKNILRVQTLTFIGITDRVQHKTGLFERMPGEINTVSFFSSN